MADPAAHALYALAWAAFGLVHSALATETAKGWLRPRLGRAVRFAYTLLAVVQVALVLAAAAWLFPERTPFTLPRWGYGALDALFAAGCAVMLAGARSFHVGRFLGLAQLRGAAGDEDAFTTRGPLAYIRHPLYAGGLLILAGGAHDEAGLATALWGGLYLLIGARLEERRLLRQLGAPYAEYRRRVPAFIPWRGRAIPPET